MLRRGLVKHCAVCGSGHLFRHWVRMVPECPKCGFVFTRISGHWLGSWFLNVCVVQTAVVLILLIGVGTTWPEPPMVAIAVGACTAAVVVPFAFFPFSRTIWVAIDLVMTPLGFDDGVAPGVLLADDVARLEQERSGQ